MNKTVCTVMHDGFQIIGRIAIGFTLQTSLLATL
ncbi:hypothetical protein EPIR_1736 [Erwinia piriflorinigrans CFBP 5888]|uniref:Uncharacterized protein n=1 Tax=Erwinia piriflorinigrans CFBP 5888 TaxID=1161919 RepID=V5Z7T6_9GAMM|nr:hypothetical protein EPIR_1736 [Erwinia piriflorinigrans CFBP 5888]